MIKTKKSLFVRFIVIGTIFIALVVSIALYRYFQLQIDSYVNQLEYCESEKIIVDSVNTQQLLSENQTIDSCLILLDENGDSISFQKIIEKSTIVYRFFDSFCFACVETDIGILKEIGKVIGSDRIILISDYTNTNKSKILKEKYSLEFRVFSCLGEISLPVETNFDQVPYFFVLESNLKTRLVYLTDSDNHYDKLYFRVIRQYSFLD